MGKYGFSKRSKQLLSTVDERLQKLANEVIDRTEIDFGISAGKRTAIEQFELFIAGYSKCDGYKVLSKHQTGRAIDFFCVVGGKLSYDNRSMKYVADLFKKVAAEMGLEIVWGGDWVKFVDMPHIELRG